MPTHRRRLGGARRRRADESHSRATRLLERCSSWFDTKDLVSASQQTLINRADPFDDDPMILGATTGVDASDPTRLPMIGEPYVSIPTTGGNSLVRTISATGTTLTAVVDMSRDDWAPTGAVTRYVWASGAGIRLGLLALATGELRLYGGADFIVSSGHPTSGRVQWRMRRNSSTNDASLAWRVDGILDPDASGWNVSASGPITDGTSAGSRMGDSVDGAVTTPTNFYRFILDVDGTVFEDWTPDTGLTVNDGWAVTRATSGATVAVVPATRGLLMFDGSDDRCVLPTIATPAFTRTTGQFACLMLMRRHNDWPNNVDRYLCFESSNNNGLDMRDNAAQNSFTVQASDGTGHAPAGVLVTDGTDQAIGAVVRMGGAASYVHGTGISAFALFSTDPGDPVFTQGKVGVRAFDNALPNAFQMGAVCTWDRIVPRRLDLDVVSARFKDGNYR